MKQYSALNWLVPLIAVLVFVSAGAGLFWNNQGIFYSFTTLYGETVTIYGKGLYEQDTIFSLELLWVQMWLPFSLRTT